MHDTKVVKLLSNFSPADWKRFRDFLASPIFNKETVILDFYELLRVPFPKIPTSEQVLAKLYPGQSPSDAARLNRLKTRLVALIREYVDFQARYREDDRLLHALARCAEWWERGEHQFHRQEIEHLQDALGPDNMLHANRDLLRFQLSSHVIGHAPHYLRKTMLTQMQDAYFSLDAFQRLQKLRFLCFLRHQIRFSSEEIPSWLATEFAAAAQLLDADVPLSQLYFSCFQSLQDPENPALQSAFAQALDKLEPQLAREEARELYQFVINFHIRAFNRHQNNPQTLKDLQELYERLLTRKILLEKGHISDWNYKNIVSVMARGTDLDWLDQFMDEYESRIRFDYAGNAAHFCRGLVAFYRADFRETARRMERVLQSFRSVFWGLEARSLLMQAHFELEDHSGLEATYNSIRMYLERKAKLEVSDAYRTSYGNFYRFLYKLDSILTGNRDKQQEKLHKLRARIDATQPLPNKKWLLQKVSERLLA